MVEFDLPAMFANDFIARIPEQQKQIDLLIKKGVIKLYSLAKNQSKLWLIANGQSEFEIMELISKLPLSNFMIPSISSLSFLHTAQDENSRGLVASS